MDWGVIELVDVDAIKAVVGRINIPDTVTNHPHWNILDRRGPLSQVEAAEDHVLTARSSFLS